MKEKIVKIKVPAKNNKKWAQELKDKNTKALAATNIFNFYQ